ncbi:dTDP-4-dehydrorhamnose 3,5-epimerase family protein [Streptomyces sp. NPDC051561]|uniref:dTDP-4-dehydrorhamnose 3,5-epimerase family protein n=1 Tax=Streptomyces sp. NPDC051561 TaxID=3365658 RepID=UPI0037981ABC
MSAPGTAVRRPAEAPDTFRALRVAGAYAFTPKVHRDDRGAFVSPLQEGAFTAATGHPPFPVAQVSTSVSRRGVLRGIHYCAAPPGLAQYVYCPRGRALDLVVDVREGSPTFGAWDTVLLDQEDCRATYLPVGVGHAMLALEDGTVMSYLLSDSYLPRAERYLDPLDPALGLPLPVDVPLLVSDRDRTAPSLADARARGLLPSYAACQEREASWRTG